MGTAGEFALREGYLAEFPPAELSAEGLTWQDYQAQSCPPEAMLKVLQHLEERYGGKRLTLDCGYLACDVHIILHHGQSRVAKVLSQEKDIAAVQKERGRIGMAQQVGV